MNNYYTYAYLREDGTPYYIGKGKGDRIHSSNRRLKLPIKDRRIYLKRNLTEEEAFNHEIYMISVFGRKDLGTGILVNMTNGGEGNPGHIVSKELRMKMSQSHKGKVLSYEHRRKISEANRKRKHSEETKKKIGEANKGKKLSPEHNILLHQSNIGNQYRKDKKTSEETKLKLRNSNSSNWKITFDNGTTLKGKFSIREMCEKYGYDRKCIYNLMKGKTTKHKDIISVERID